MSEAVRIRSRFGQFFKWPFTAWKIRIGCVALLLVAAALYITRETNPGILRIESLGGWTAGSPARSTSVPVLLARRFFGLRGTSSGGSFGIVLEGRRASDADLAIIGPALPGATSIDLGCTDITDDGLAHLAAMPQLYDVSLANTQVTDQGVVHLQVFPNLFSLDLANTHITDDGLAQLPKVGQLWRINLAGTSITDDGLKHLHALPNLGWIDVTDTQVTDDGVAALREKFPKVVVHR